MVIIKLRSKPNDAPAEVKQGSMKTQFGKHLGGKSGIVELMQDLGEALAEDSDKVRMLGGGQPAHIPEMESVWRQRMEEIMAEPRGLETMLGNYDPPQGNAAFLKAMAELLRNEYGWDLTAKNLAITAGGQTAFFFLFNAFAAQGQKILLPLVPEYIGYSSQGITGDIFTAVAPRIEVTGDHEFKYRVDFDALEIGDDVAAICVSRPTNPTGNVLADNEIDKLRTLAKQKNIPLIIDNAYGVPFPGVIFTEVTPVWDESMILTLSLSKLGLPGTRTAIVVASEKIADMVASMSANVGLANGNVGQVILKPLIESGDILNLSRTVVQPFYVEKSRLAQMWVKEFFEDRFDYYVHRSEGALFLWLWFPDLPISTRDLYERLKTKGVLIIPGENFFFGLEDEEWRHRQECIRMTFTMDEDTVREGIKVIADEVEKAFKGHLR